MQEVIETACKLGQLIACHERFRRLRAAEDAVESDPDTVKVAGEFERQRRKIVQLEAERKPVEPEDKRELQRLADAVHSNRKLQDLLKAQADYMEMMNKVNAAIRKHLDAEGNE